MADFLDVPDGTEIEIQWGGGAIKMLKEKHWARDTCEVISVHSMEQQEADEKDESEASDDHSAQRETVATFSLNDLGGNNKITQTSIKPFPHFSGIWITLTEPTRTCITISPIPALVTRTDVAHPAQKNALFKRGALTAKQLLYISLSPRHLDNRGCLRCRRACRGICC